MLGGMEVLCAAEPLVLRKRYIDASYIRDDLDLYMCVKPTM